MFIILILLLCDFASQIALSSENLNCGTNSCRKRRAPPCVLPPTPNHGFYTSNVPFGSPGDTFPTIFLNVTCNPGYKVQGSSDAVCYQGNWFQPIPSCVKMEGAALSNSFCELTRHPSVRYRCLVDGPVVGHRACRSHEPSGTVVRPECNTPNYYSSEILAFMRCVDGKWDYIARCAPECGRVTPDGAQLVSGGRLAKRGELPWHTGIYAKTFSPYKQICGSTLVTNTVVISAAHCFFVEFAQPPSQFAAAVGKLHRPYTDLSDDEGGAQKSDVKDIKIPTHFQGRKANFQDDIALVYLTQAFVYQTHVRPVCLSFDFDFDKRQLAPGSVGKVAGWGLISDNGPSSPNLNVVQLPYVDISYCIAHSPPGFSEYITSDKICAGYERKGISVCRGDSGGGLVFSEHDRGVERHYLRGVVSTAPDDENLCNTQTVTTFTHIIKHEHFIKEYLNNPQPTPCVPPPPPAYGSYTTSTPESPGGQNFPSLRLHVSCRPGHRRVGAAEIDCISGLWSDIMPKCVRDLSQGKECRWKGLVGTCVEPHRCLTTLDKSSQETPPVCSKKGSSKICCTDCSLVNNISQAVISPVKEEGVLWKDGRRSRDKCLQYLEELPHKCDKKNATSKVRRVLDKDQECHLYEWWGDETSSDKKGKDPNAVQYPFLALLGYGETVDKVEWRGDLGVIISPRFVLTTAWRSTEDHNGGLHFLAMGVTDRSGPRDNWTIHEIKRHVVHEGYVRWSFFNDVAVMETQTPIQFNKNVLPACLPSAELVDEEAILPTYWYSTLKKSVDIIRTVKVQKYSREDCSRIYNNYNSTTQQCYGHKQDLSQSCDTWSGDPLIVTNHITSCLHTVIGIRWAGGCLQADAYTMISHYVPWIESVVWPYST